MKRYKYLHRIAEDLLDLKLKAFGAVQIVGPKWCGKTTTAEQRAASVIKMQDPDRRAGYLTTARTMPSLLLKGATPRLIDEWQVAPVIWDAVRHAVDERHARGQFILTGSTVINSDEIMHSGTGRISKVAMAPMSLYESLESNGSVSLRRLFDEPDYDIDGLTSDLTIDRLIFAACRGGWPATVDPSLPEDVKLSIAQDYVSVICNEDISRVDGVKRNPSLARLILRSYARNVCTLAKKKSMLADVALEMESTSMTTFDDYVMAFEQLFVIDDIEAWSPAIRSKSSIRCGKKRCFVDPSIAVAALGASPRSLELDLNTFGFIFECLCFRDLKVYSQALGGHLSYYHDRMELEADAVLHLADGRYALIECKLGSRDIDDGAAHLLEIKRLVKATNALREPDLLIVLTGGEMAYTRPDGVKVIPIGCLKD
jgi:hypothetical protein